MSYVILPKEISIDNKHYLAKGKWTAVICVLIIYISDYVHVLLVVGQLASFKINRVWGTLLCEWNSSGKGPFSAVMCQWALMFKMVKVKTVIWWFIEWFLTTYNRQNLMYAFTTDVVTAYLQANNLFLVQEKQSIWI